MILMGTTNTLGLDSNEIALNISTIQRKRQQYRKEISLKIKKKSFQPKLILTTHRKSKLMCDITKSEKVEKFTIGFDNG